MGKHILVTGGAGYIGSILVPELLGRGFRVTVIDNFMYNQSSLLDCCSNKSFQIIRGDVRNEDLLKKTLIDVDFIFPLACLTGAPLCAQDPFAAQTVNFDAIKTIINLRKKNQKIIFPTTNSGYGIGQQDTYCTEDTPLRPISLYGRLKAEIEKIILDSGESISFRFATIFGLSPRIRLDLLVNDFVYRAVNDSAIMLFEAHFKRNYLHVRDAARVFIHAVENFDSMKNEPYNVGLDNANLSKWELCEKIKDQLPGFVFIESEIGEDPDKRNYIVSNEKVRKKGFTAKISLSDGIKELIKGFQIIKRNSYSNV